MRTKIMRMRDDNRIETTQLVYLRHRLVIDVRETVPEDVLARGKTAEERALADGEFRGCLDGDEGGGVLGGGSEGVGVFLFFVELKGAEGCPVLALFLLIHCQD